MPAFREGKLKFDDPKHLLFAVQASGSPELVEPLLKYLQQNDLKGETADAMWGKVAELGGPNELKILWEQSLDEKLSEAQRLKRLQALEVAASQRKVKPAGDISGLDQLIKSNNTRNCRHCNTASRPMATPDFAIQNEIVKTAVNESMPSELRIASFDALTDLIVAERKANETTETGKPRRISDREIATLCQSNYSLAQKIAVRFAWKRSFVSSAITYRMLSATLLSSCQHQQKKNSQDYFR